VNGIGLAWRLARRELRAGVSGFRIFIACLALGVAAIAGVGTISESVIGGLNANASRLLGGDIALRLHNRDTSGEQEAWLAVRAKKLSKVVEMRAMAAPVKAGEGRRRSLVELKGVDGNYPLTAQVGLSPTGALSDALTRNGDGSWGAVADRSLLSRLGLAIGDTIRVGEAIFTVNATITAEPDRVANVLSFGPRLMVAMAALEGTGLVQPGSQIHYKTRLLLKGGIDAKDFQTDLEQKFPKAGWRVRTPDRAAPGIRRFIDRMTLFLSFVGLSALLVGGIGVSSAVASYLGGKTATIATFKCLGSPGSLVFNVYLLQIMVLGAVGVGIGLVIGGLIPIAVLSLLKGVLPVAPEITFYPEPLLLAAGFGLLTALTFALWPLGRARQIPAATLFRDHVQPSHLRPGRSSMLATVAGIAALAGLTILTASDRHFAYWFVGGALATFLCLRLGAALLMSATAAFKKSGSAERRLALANIYRPGSNTPSIVLSLGLGMSVLIAVALIEGNLSYQVNERLPDQAPAFFFIDIQPEQVEDFDATVTSMPGTGNFRRMPSLRGRIVAIDGVPIEQAVVAPQAQWAVNGDRALTSSAQPTEDSDIIEGEWWPEDYVGPPVISLDAGLARGFGVGLGDTLTLNVLGREITGTITSLREIDWRSLRFDFAIIFAPGPLEGAPYTHIAAVEASPEIEDALEEAVSAKFTNITAIRVREALAAAAIILAGIGDAVRGTSLITILAGALVLGGAIAAGQRKRIYTAVVFKVLGATRRRLLKVFVIEFGILGLATGIIAAAIGTLTAWAVIVFLMRADWIFLAPVVAITVALCLVITVIAGFAGTWRALAEKATVHLRNE